MYVGVFVQLHNIAFAPQEEFLPRLKKLLCEEFKPEYDSDIEVTLEESAGLCKPSEPSTIPK